MHDPHDEAEVVPVARVGRLVEGDRGIEEAEDERSREEKAMQHPPDEVVVGGGIHPCDTRVGEPREEREVGRHNQHGERRQGEEGYDQPSYNRLTGSTTGDVALSNLHVILVSL